MYKAIDIAKYIINKSIEFNRPISNLQLQKILYYVQGEYIKVTKGCKLFDEDLEAWAYGPVVPEVYYEFNKYSSSNITSKYDIGYLDKEIQEIIDPIIKEKSLLSAWRLVEETHNETPWKISYEENKNNKINLNVMKDYFIN